MSSNQNIHHSGFIGIVGRPNVGKSTLLNSILGEKIAITTPKPQTTRNRIMGIKNLPDGQLIFIDTPGIHEAKNPLNRVMVAEAKAVFSSVDLVMVTIEAPCGFLSEDMVVIETAKASNLPLLLAINKIDLTTESKVKEIIKEAPTLAPFCLIFPVSAITRQGLDALIDGIKNMLPRGPAYFPPDMITDRTERFLVAETIREKIMLHTHEELPYSSAVSVDTFKEDEQKNLLIIAATITVERESQKKIIIGRQGTLLKKIGTDARIELEKFFGTRVYLSLFVRVRHNWTRAEKWIKEFGYKN
ncbi:MAG: GTPase Era [Syntrophales bacterium]|nr:GTPase Era [Syntrophales bacterium]